MTKNKYSVNQTIKKIISVENMLLTLYKLFFQTFFIIFLQLLTALNMMVNFFLIFKIK
jgi:hypothetical protein